MVRKYDAHTFFQGLSGVGLKGVDFIAVRPGCLALIEVKNYRRMRNGRVRDTVRRSLDHPELISDSIIHKCLDTMRAIRAIQAHYLRKWGYRLTLPFLGRFRWQWSDHSFWTHVSQALSNPQQVTLLVWLATDPTDRRLSQRLEHLIAPSLDDQVGTLQVTDEQNQPLHGIKVEWLEESAP